MATIVEHKKDGRRYVLLGAGFGAYQSKKPNLIFGNLVGDVEEGIYEMLCTCDASGKIYWFLSSTLRIVSIDDQSPEEALRDW